MKDFIGNTLLVGDFVILAEGGQNGMVFGRIKNMDETLVTVEIIKRPSEHYAIPHIMVGKTISRHPYQVVKTVLDEYDNSIPTDWLKILFGEPK